MKKIVFGFLSLLIGGCVACSHAASENNEKPKPDETTLAEKDLERAISIIETAFNDYSSDGTMALSMKYNPFTKQRSSNLVSIWEYTSTLEAVSGAMNAMIALNDAGYSTLYNSKFDSFHSLLEKIYNGMQYYKGTFTLTSYTGTATWSPYGVNRGSAPGSASVDGILNVYDDQMWIIREFINAYKATGDSKFLKEAEYLTAYVLDGWDCTLDDNGKENGGITWGPGYVTKHTCSNGPVISPLVWLSELYKGKSDEITYGIVNKDKTRGQKTELKETYYKEMAAKVYKWQKGCLLRSDGVYDDLMGGYHTGDGQPEYETVGGVRYRKNTDVPQREGPAYTYNSGTPLSGAIDLYRVTSDQNYLDDAKALTDASFSYFAKYGASREGYYSYSVDNVWFHDVLLRGYIAASEYYSKADVYVKSFQDNLDCGWDNYLKDGMLPISLLAGWNKDSSKNEVNLMYTFARAADYANLAVYQLKKANN